MHIWKFCSFDMYTTSLNIQRHVRVPGSLSGSSLVGSGSIYMASGYYRQGNGTGIVLQDPEPAPTSAPIARVQTPPCKPSFPTTFPLLCQISRFKKKKFGPTPPDSTCIIHNKRVTFYIAQSYPFETATHIVMALSTYTLRLNLHDLEILYYLGGGHLIVPW